MQNKLRPGRLDCYSDDANPIVQLLLREFDLEDRDETRKRKASLVEIFRHEE